MMSRKVFSDNITYKQAPKEVSMLYEKSKNIPVRGQKVGAPEVGMYLEHLRNGKGARVAGMEGRGGRKRRSYRF